MKHILLSAHWRCSFGWKDFLWSTRARHAWLKGSAAIRPIWRTLHFEPCLGAAPQENTTKPQWETSMGLLIEGDRPPGAPTQLVAYAIMVTGDGCKECKAPKRFFRPFFHSLSISCSTIFVSSRLFSSLPTWWCFVVRVNCSRFWWWVYLFVPHRRTARWVRDRHSLLNSGVEFV